LCIGTSEIPRWKGTMLEAGEAGLGEAYSGEGAYLMDRLRRFHGAVQESGHEEFEDAAGLLVAGLALLVGQHHRLL
jgi:hypothetical protein